MEFVSLAVDKLLEYTLLPVARQVGYVIFYKNNVAELKNQADELPLERESVQHRVDNAKRNVEEIEGVVLKWLSDVDEIASKAKELLDEDDKRRKNTGCSSRSFPNLCWRHQHSRRAKKTALEIVNIKSRKQFDKVSYRGELKIIETGSSSTTNDEAFESRVLALNQIMEALADPNLNMIGVYGLGGVGKTTLVHEVAKKAKEKSSGLVVVIATVKQNPEIKEIQQQIAEMLGIKFEEKTLVARAARLRQRLEQEENILVILDDLWKMLKLDEIGIPYGKENKKCKILMTSRNRAVLSDYMNTQKNFKLTELAEAEAWKLFKEKAALNESSETDQLLSVARDVAAECGGLPIALVTVASSLKGKKISEWNDVLRRLRNHLYSDINAPVEVSYENLEEDRLKSIFVLAGVITSSSTMDLFQYSCGLGLFHDMNKMKESQDSFETCIRKLKDSCLLQDNNYSGDNFTMHDIVRDVAISIASRDQQLFLKKNEKLGEEEWPKDGKLKSCKTIILHDSNIEKLPGGLDCANLTFLHIYNNDHSLKLPDNFFERMPSLKVLDLTKINFEFLPSSISLLSNLHSLCLDQCVLGDIVIIGELKGLKVLSLNSSKIEHLPPEIGKLTKLQLLDLSGCDHLKLIPPHVLLNLKMLEVLFIGDGSFDQWATDHQQSTTSLSELNDLSLLNTLVVRVPDENMLPKEPLFEKLQLQRYEVVIGDSKDWFGESKYSRILKLDFNIGIDSMNYFKSLLEHVEDLSLTMLKGAKNVIPEINEKGLLELKNLNITTNSELQFIADSVGYRDLIPNLESLNVYELSNLVKLCNGSLTEGSFSKLKAVKVMSCHKMKTLFSFSLPRCLPQLNELQVSYCDSLEGIVSDDGKFVGILQFAELRTLELGFLPALIGFYYEDKTSSKAQRKKMQFVDDKDPREIIDNNSLDPPVALFFEKVIFPNLETLALRRVRKLNKIWDWQGQQFCNLKTLFVLDCVGISKLIPFHVLEFLHNLEELEVKICDSLEVVFDLEGTTKEGTHAVVKSSHLRKLILTDLPKLKHVWNKDPFGILDFQCLSVIRVSKCDSLKYLFPVSVAKALVKLEELTIRNCSELENIVGRKEEGLNDSISFVFPQVTIMGLEDLPKLGRFYPGTYSTEWPLLQELHHVSVNWEVNIFGCGLIKWNGEDRVEGPAQEPLSVEKRVLNLKMETLVIDRSFEEIFPFEKQTLKRNQYGSIVQVKEYSSLLNLVPSSATFNHLKSLNVEKCEQLLYLIVSSMAKSLSQLTTIEIKECKMIKEIVADNVANVEIIDEITFSKLKILKLQDLPCLESFCSMNYVFNFPYLEEVVICQCPKMKIFSKGFSTTPNLPNINLKEESPRWEGSQREGPWEGDLNSTVQKLYTNQLYYPQWYLNLSEYPELKQIWDRQLDGVSFLYLNTLTLSNCEWFSKVLPLNLLKCLYYLEKLKVESCNSVEVVFDLEGATKKEVDAIPKSHFRKLTLTSLPNLKHVWNKDPQGIFYFQSLRSVSAENCTSLEYLFPASIVKALVQLEKLKIKSCGLDNIVAGEEGQDASMSSVFPKLTYLQLLDLPKLRNFAQEPLSVGKAIPNLKDLAVDNNEAIITWLERFPEDHFNKLEVLRLVCFHDTNTRFPHISFLQKMSKVETLAFENCPFEEIFSFEAVKGNQYGSAVQVKRLALFELCKLRHICKEGHELDPSLKNLEKLQVEECSSLLNLVPSLVTFNHLTSLRVCKCEGMLALMASSTAKGLGQLIIMEIEECEMIKEIVADNVTDGETIDEITFSKLEILKLKNLPMLESFCSMNYVFNFPSLENVVIWQCPKMKIFSNRVSYTPNLQYIHEREEEEGDNYWEGDLNSTVQKMYTDMVASGNTRSEESESKENSSSHNFSQGNDHALSHVDTKGKNTHQNEQDKKHQVEGTATIKNELVGGGKGVDEELSFRCTQEEAFDLQKETPDVEGFQVQLTLDPEGGNVKEKGGHSLETSEVNIHTGVYAQSRAEDTNAEASKASLLDTGVVTDKSKPSIPIRQNGDCIALGQGKKGTIHEGVVHLNSTVQKLYTDMDACGSTRSKASEGKDNLSSHSSSQSDDQALSHVDTKGKNKQLKELDRNHRVEGEGHYSVANLEQISKEESFAKMEVPETRMAKGTSNLGQKETPKVEGVQVQLAIDPEGGSVMEKGGHSSKASKGSFSEFPNISSSGRLLNEECHKSKQSQVMEVHETPQVVSVESTTSWGNTPFVAAGPDVPLEEVYPISKVFFMESDRGDNVNIFDVSLPTGTASNKNELVGDGKVVDLELSMGHAQEEAFDLQKETPEVRGVQVQLTMESTDKGAKANIPDNDLPVGVYAQSRAEDIDVEASKASLPDTGDVPHQNKQSTPVGQNGNSNALGQGKEGTIHEGVVLSYSNESVVSSQGTMGIDVGTVASALSRLRLCAIALCFLCFTLLGCSFLLDYWGSGMPLVSISPSLPIPKDTVELNKDHIALLRDAFASYPNLWEPREDFSARFHGWAYKTLADLLCFLKTESPMTITKEREKEFLVLCNEAIQFGFDKTWVEEMRKRVTKDPEVDRAQMRLIEILEKEEELRREKEKLNEFLQGRRKKFFG